MLNVSLLELATNKLCYNLFKEWKKTADADEINSIKTLEQFRAAHINESGIENCKDLYWKNDDNTISMDAMYDNESGEVKVLNDGISINLITPLDNIPEVIVNVVPVEFTNAPINVLHIKTVEEFVASKTTLRTFGVIVTSTEGNFLIDYTIEE